MRQALDDLERVLFDKASIDRKVEELAAEISRDYESDDLVLVTVLRGGIFFLADLSRKLSIRHTFDLVGASSYGDRAQSDGQVLITKDVEIPLADRNVLLVEDIYDTGETMKVVCDLLRVHGPKSLEICALLIKDRPRRHELPVRYAGFHVPNVFVVGYGLDYGERYRHLNCIGVLKPEIYLQ